MNHALRLIIISLCFFLCACIASRYDIEEIPQYEIPSLFHPMHPQACESSDLSPTEYRILTTVIDTLVPTRYSQIILGDSTISFSFPWYPKLDIDSVTSRSLISRLKIISSHRTTFCPDSIRDARQKLLLSQSQFDRAYRRFNYRAVWDAYYKRFPHTLGIIKFSRVAFDTSGSLAVIYITHMYRDAAGEERLFLLVEHANDWTIKQSYLIDKYGIEF